MSQKKAKWAIRSQAPKTRYDKGMEKVQRLNGSGSYMKVVIKPDMAQDIVHPPWKLGGAHGDERAHTTII
jgi:hypothetical protein